MVNPTAFALKNYYQLKNPINDPSELIQRLNNVHKNIIQEFDDLGIIMKELSSETMMDSVINEYDFEFTPTDDSNLNKQVCSVIMPPLIKKPLTSRAGAASPGPVRHVRPTDSSQGRQPSAHPEVVSQTAGAGFEWPGLQ